MTAAIALWVLGPLALFLVLSIYVVFFMGLRTKGLKFRTRMTSPTPALGRRALLVNVVVPAGEPPAGGPGA
ncbi:hypothetical protein GCM10022254_19170 [Actinomadura meridiana]|uniref:Uncharacterized protein n=1 Tax=Actinomadura meridiana TaxID=559626 RepID=A0ABP8BWI9_9ACTN